MATNKLEVIKPPVPTICDVHAFGARPAAIVITIANVPKMALCNACAFELGSELMEGQGEKVGP